MISYPAFWDEWRGKRVGDPLLIGRGETEATMYQCVSYVKQGWREMFDMSIDWPGNAIDIWNHPTEALMNACYKVESSEAIAGDLVVFKTKGYNGPASNDTGYGHIGWASGNINASQLEISEQNGATGGGTGTGGDAIRTRWVDRARVAGMYRRRAPVAPPQALYAVTETYPQGKKVKLTKQPTYKWGMNYNSFEYMAAHWVEQHDAGEIKTVTNKVHHNITGYDYYRESDQVDGYNVLDCEDYFEPVPVYTPPAPPVEVPKAERYKLLDDLDAYGSAIDAQMARNKTVRLSVSRDDGYYVWSTDGDSKLIGPSNQNRPNPETWINTTTNVAPVVVPVKVAPVPSKVSETIKNASDIADQLAQPALPTRPAVPPTVIPPTVPEPTPAQWKKLSLFMPDGRAVPYKVKQISSIEIYDLSNKQYVDMLHAGQKLKLVGTFSKDGRLYGVPQACVKPDIWPNVPMGMVQVDLIRQFYELVKKLPVVERVIKRIDGITK